MKQQLKKYNNYKDSGIEWLGEIPTLWNVRRIKESSKKVKTGTTPSTKDGDFFSDGTENWYTPVDIKNNFITSSSRKVIKQAFKDNQISLFEENSIFLIGIGGTLGNVAISKTKSSCNQQINVITINEKINNSKFCFYQLILIGNTLLKWCNYTTMPIFTQTATKQLELALPPLKEQTQIANYLDAKTTAIDKKVNLLQQKIKHYKAYRKTLINETVTKGLDKTVKLKDSGINWIGDIPEHWEVKRYKSFGKTIKGKNMEMSDIEFDNSLPLLSLEYLRNDSVEHPTFCFSNDKSLKSTEEDLIIVWDGAAVGEILKSKVGYVSSTIAKLDINKKKFNTRYFYHLRGAIDYKLKQIPTGMGIPHLNPTLFKNFQCPSPPIKEQQQIANYLDTKTTTIDKIVKNIETQITTLKELRKTLINEVVTGRVKVSA